MDGSEPTSALPDEPDGSAVAADTDVETATEPPVATPADPHDSPAPQHPHDPEEVTR